MRDWMTNNCWRRRVGRCAGWLVGFTILDDTWNTDIASFLDAEDTDSPGFLYYHHNLITSNAFGHIFLPMWHKKSISYFFRKNPLAKFFYSVHNWERESISFRLFAGA